MITKEEFTEFISTYNKYHEAIDRFDQAITGKSYTTILFETDWDMAVGKMLDLFLDSHFTELGVDWINYYLWEPIEDKRVYITKEADMFYKEEKIEYHLNSIDELWDFLLTDKKAYFKNV